jgi:hypothetical protein
MKNPLQDIETTVATVFNANYTLSAFHKEQVFKRVNKDISMLDEKIREPTRRETKIRLEDAFKLSSDAEMKQEVHHLAMDQKISREKAYYQLIGSTRN